MRYGVVLLVALAGCAEAYPRSTDDGAAPDSAPAADATPAADTTGPTDAAVVDATITIDAAPSIDAEPIVDAATARCDPESPFGLPMPLTTINSGSNDYGPDLSADELHIYFSSNRVNGAGRLDLYTASRTTRYAPFGAPTPIPGANTADSEGGPRVTADGLTLYAQVSRSGWFHLERSTRGTPSASFGGFAAVPQVNSTSSDTDVFVPADQSALYFASNRAGNFDLYRTAAIGSNFATPVVIAGTDLATDAIERYPVLSADQLTLWFSSDRAYPGSGEFDIWVTTRASITDDFGPASLAEELTSDATEFPGWVSPDGCAFYFTRQSGSQFELYVAERGL